MRTKCYEPVAAGDNDDDEVYDESTSEKEAMELGVDRGSDELDVTNNFRHLVLILVCMMLISATALGVDILTNSNIDDSDENVGDAALSDAGNASPTKPINFDDWPSMLLINDPKSIWRVSYGSENENREGTLHFRSDQHDEEALLSWHAGPPEWAPTTSAKVDRFTVLKKYTAEIVDHDDYCAAAWMEGDRTFEFRGPPDMSLGDFEDLLGTLRGVTSRHEWFEAMPDHVVTLENREKVARKIVLDIPILETCDGSKLTAMTSRIMDLHHFSIHVISTVACDWIEYWIDALAQGDKEKACDAVDAISSSYEWKTLRTMHKKGITYAEKFWVLTEKIRGDPAILKRTYKHDFGCKG